MITVTYKCDKCGNEETTGDQFWKVGVAAHPHNSSFSTFLAGRTMHVCRPCLESLGIHVTAKPPTLEDMIREIVANAVSDL